MTASEAAAWVGHWNVGAYSGNIQDAPQTVDQAVANVQKVFPGTVVEGGADVL
jgi:hypothetical protein